MFPNQIEINTGYETNCYRYVDKVMASIFEWKSLKSMVNSFSLLLWLPIEYKNCYRHVCHYDFLKAKIHRFYFLQVKKIKLRMRVLLFLRKIHRTSHYFGVALYIYLSPTYSIFGPLRCLDPIQNKSLISIIN